MLNTSKWNKRWTKILRERLRATTELSHEDIESVTVSATSQGKMWDAKETVKFQEFGVRGTGRLNTGLNHVRPDSPYAFRKKSVGSRNIKDWANGKGIMDDGVIYVIARSIASKGIEAKDQIQRALDETINSEGASFELAMTDKAVVTRLTKQLEVISVVGGASSYAAVNELMDGKASGSTGFEEARATINAHLRELELAIIKSGGTEKDYMAVRESLAVDITSIIVETRGNSNVSAVKMGVMHDIIQKYTFMGNGFSATKAINAYIQSSGLNASKKQVRTLIKTVEKSKFYKMKTKLLWQ